MLAAKPDLVIISGLAADGGNLVKQLRELGYKGLIVGGNGFNTTNLFPVCKALCDGIRQLWHDQPDIEDLRRGDAPSLDVRDEPHADGLDLG